jgi:hypothetical protein
MVLELLLKGTVGLPPDLELANVVSLNRSWLSHQTLAIHQILFYVQKI